MTTDELRKLRARMARYLLRHSPMETATHYGRTLGHIYRIKKEFGVVRIKPRRRK